MSVGVLIAVIFGVMWLSIVMMSVAMLKGECWMLFYWVL